MVLGIIGAGYVGLTLAACLAELGHEVLCHDQDLTKMSGLRQGVIPVYEAGLEELVERHGAKGLLFVDRLGELVAKAPILFVCVGTPSDEAGQADISSVLAVAQSIAESARAARLVVLKSTVPVGTAERVQRVLDDNAARGVRHEVVSNPEFMRQGQAVYDTLNPMRTIIGTESESAAERLRTVYEKLQAPVVVCNHRTAEMAKYAANCFLAVRISAINEIANLCEHVGADILPVVETMGYDPRIGNQYLSPGIGFGGSCLPKDTRALLHMAREADCDTPLMAAVITVNEAQKMWAVRRLEESLGSLSGLTVAVWGLAFKPGTDDLREAPALHIVHALLRRGCLVKAFDPLAGHKLRGTLPGLDIVDSPLDAVREASAVVLTTEWPRFRQVDFRAAARLMKRALLIDGRNALAGLPLAAMGFEYLPLGRGAHD